MSLVISSFLSKCSTLHTLLSPLLIAFFVCLFKLHALRSAVQYSMEGAGGDGVPVAQQSIPEYKMEIRWV